MARVPRPRGRHLRAHGTVPAAALLVLIGAEFHTSWLPRRSNATRRVTLSPVKTSPATVVRDEGGTWSTPSLVYGDGHVGRLRRRQRETRFGQEGRLRGGERSIAIQMIHEYLASITRERSAVSASDSETIPERARQAALVG